MQSQAAGPRITLPVPLPAPGDILRLRRALPSTLESPRQCGGAGSEDRAYHWVTPADGLYSFRATSQSFTPVVSLLDGPRCSDRVIACNAAASRFAVC